MSDRFAAAAGRKVVSRASAEELGKLTHLVVEAEHRLGNGHLVPISLVESATSEIRLRCTIAEFNALEDAEETQFLPGASGDWDYQQQQMLSLPYYGLGTGTDTRTRARARATAECHRIPRENSTAARGSE